MVTSRDFHLVHRDLLIPTLWGYGWRSRLMKSLTSTICFEEKGIHVILRCRDLLEALRKSSKVSNKAEGNTSELPKINFEGVNIVELNKNLNRTPAPSETVKYFIG